MTKLGIGRVIIFAKDMDMMSSFYGDVLGLPRIETPDDSPTFISFDAGAVQLALHRIPEEYARDIDIADPPIARESTPIKFAFRVDNVSEARTDLELRGASMGPIHQSGPLHLCDGTDPEGNIFQISNRP